ncbi:MAG: NAD(+) synthase [Firmicutes bacterium]|nr:NAD(+) synthase [Bacillota bacterium]
MNKNFKIAAITPNIFIGNIKKNTAHIIEQINNCDANLAVLPSNAISGEIYDMRIFSAVAKNTLSALTKIAQNISIPAVVGFYYYEHNLAAFIENKKVRGVAILNEHKNQTILDFPHKITNNFILEDGQKLLIEGQHILEEIPRLFDEMSIIAIPASYPAYLNGFENKKSALRKLSFRNDGCYTALSCSHPSDSTKDFIRAGDKIIASKGQILAASTLDNNNFIISNSETTLPSPIDSPSVLSFMPENYKEAFDIIARGIYYRMEETGNKKAILGLSGGLDSACALLLTIHTFDKYNLDRQNIIAVSMPSNPTSTRTKNNAYTLATELKVTFHEISIAKSVSRHLKNISHQKKDIVYENTQSRERAKILLDLSNKHEALFIGTSNMIESALGFCTYGGDTLAHYNPLSSLVKSVVKTLVEKYLINLEENSAQTSENTNLILIQALKDILDTPFSPELKKGQDTQKILGPYPLHEYFLLHLIAFNETSTQIIEGAINAFPKLSKIEIKKYYKLFINRFFKNRFKTLFSCDGIRLFPHALNNYNICWNFSNDLYL